MNNHPVTPLLVVEDSDEDYTTLMRIFKKISVSHPIKRCANAKECFEYLRAVEKQTPINEENFPALMLLDLNMPGTDGHAVLQQVKAEPMLRHLPVVIVTTSTNPKDVKRCYEEGASSYLVKAVDYTVYEQTIRRFIDYWFNAVRLPFPGEVA